VWLAGRLSYTYDVFPLSKTFWLSEANVGRYASFYNVREYSVVFNIPFHCWTKPRFIIKTTEGEFKLVRNETSYEQLFTEEGEDIA